MQREKDWLAGGSGEGRRKEKKHAVGQDGDPAFTSYVTQRTPHPGLDFRWTLALRRLRLRHIYS